MGEIETAATLSKRRKKKKKGRPSLLDLQIRSIKQQQQNHDKTPLSSNKNPNHYSNPKRPEFRSQSPFPSRRSARRNPNPDNPDSIHQSEHENDDDDDDDEDDERQTKKHKPLVGLNSQQQQLLLQLQRNSGDNLEGVKVSKATDGVQGSPVKHGPTTPLPDKKLLVFILDRLQKKDTHGVFSEPVDPEELPDYLEVVQHPMDFSTVRKKLDGGAYANLEEFEKDALLICSNAMEYNSPDTIYFRQAKAMQEIAKRDFENLREEDDDGEPQPRVVRRGRPPGKLKKSVEKSAVDRVGPEFSSDTTLATEGDDANVSNGYTRRKTTPYKYQPADASVRSSLGSHSNENNATWMSEIEKEFPASVVRAVLKYGQKLSASEENKRDTYNYQPSSTYEPSIFNTFEGELKQLMAVGLNSELGYARSLARFAANIGPVAWRIASKKIEKVLPTGYDFGPGWVEAKKLDEGRQLPFLNKQTIPNNTACNDNSARLVPVTSTTVTNPSAMGRSVSREEIVGGFGGYSSRSELNTMNNTIGGLKHILHPNMNGLSSGYGSNSSTQLVPTKLISPGFGMLSNNHASFSPMLGNAYNSSNMNQSENPNGISLAGGNPSDSHTLLQGGQGGKMPWQGVSSNYQQEFVTFPPDLNVGFVGPNSPSSSMPVGSPRQPDLALQL